uniref:Uncharacterized protein n=1 Tax=Opuntia streptacantha TaxID=393608 RepID=A0A7C9CVV6_OPUST
MATRRLLATRSSNILQVGGLVAVDKGAEEDEHQADRGGRANTHGRGSANRKTAATMQQEMGLIRTYSMLDESSRGGPTFCLASDGPSSSYNSEAAQISIPGLSSEHT